MIRLIPLLFKASVKKQLRAIGRENGISDLAYMEDLLALFRTKGNNIPSVEEAVAMARKQSKGAKMSASLAVLIAKKRVTLLTAFVSIPYFHRAVERVENGKMKYGQAISIVLSLTQQMARQLQRSQCGTCKYLSNCGLGRELNEKGLSAAAAFVEGYESRIHPDCPEKESMDSQSAALAVAQLYRTIRLSPNVAAEFGLSSEDVAEENKAMQSVGGSAKSEESDDVSPSEIDDENDRDVDDTQQGAGHSSGIGSSAGINPGPVAQAVLSSNFPIFDIARKLDLALDSAEKAKLRDTPNLTEHTKVRTISSVSDASRALPTEMALPDSSFDAKLAKKTMMYRKEQEKFGAPLVYLLVDISGSMTCILPGKILGHSGLRRNGLAKALCAAIANNTVRKRGLLYLRFFDTKVTNLVGGDTPEDAKMVANLVYAHGYKGGGTNLLAAIMTACQDIKSAAKHSQLSKADIILVSDMEDYSISIAPGETRNDTTKESTGSKMRAALNDCGASLAVLNLLGSANKEEMIRQYQQANIPESSIEQYMSSCSAITLQTKADYYYAVDGTVTNPSELVKLAVR